MPRLTIGLISGTSMDGIDAVLADCSDVTPAIMATHSEPIPTELKSRLGKLVDQGEKAPVAELMACHQALANPFTKAVNHLLQLSNLTGDEIEAIGLHGQTVLHQPDAESPFTLQLGDANRLAANTGITTVFDFRSADLVAGGQGAPLAPLLHRQLFLSETETRGILNLGGIANLTVLNPAGGVSGWDTGPANCLMDRWIQQHQEQAFDANGDWAASGTADEALIERMLSDPYFSAAPPKSTGTDYFNSAWTETLLGECSSAPVDIQRSFLELTVRTVAEAVHSQTNLQRLLVCGGGAHNRFLMMEIQRVLPDLPVESTASYGVDPDWVEGLLFAWLASERLLKHKIDTGPVTGASYPVLLGSICA